MNDKSAIVPSGSSAPCTMDVMCPAMDHIKSRLVCKKFPFRACLKCGHRVHDMFIKKRVLRDIVPCPVMAAAVAMEEPDNAVLRVDIQRSVDRGFEPITRETCLFIRPFMQCPSCEHGRAYVREQHGPERYEEIQPTRMQPDGTDHARERNPGSGPGEAPEHTPPRRPRNRRRGARAARPEPNKSHA